MSPGMAAAVGGGVLLVGYVVYRYMRSRSSATAVGTTAGGVIPATLSVTPGSVTAAPTTFTAWMKRAFADAGLTGYGYATFLNDVNSWLTGQCVSANGFKALNGVLPSLGAPPNRSGTTDRITVCSTRTKATTPPATKATTPPTTKATTPPPHSTTWRTTDHHGINPGGRGIFRGWTPFNHGIGAAALFTQSHTQVSLGNGLSGWIPNGATLTQILKTTPQLRAAAAWTPKKTR